MGAYLRRPPAFALLASLLLLAVGAATGGIMLAFQDSVSALARAEIIKRPEVHGFAGMELIDERRITEVVDQVIVALRLFHTHSLGLGVFILVATIVIANLVVSERVRGVLCAMVSFGAIMPFGWAAMMGLIPFWGIDRIRPPIEWLVFVPSGTLLIIGVTGAVLAYILSSVVRLAGPGE